VRIDVPSFSHGEKSLVEVRLRGQGGFALSVGR
jgi:hypothetical protein